MAPVSVSIAPGGPHHATRAADDSTWQEAIDAAWAQNSWAPATSWYEANTGHEALGIAVGDLTPGTITSSYDGQVFEGIEGGTAIRVEHNNVTVRGCRLSNAGDDAIRLTPKYRAPLTGVLIEYCTVHRSIIDPDGSEGIAAAHVNVIARTPAPGVFDATIRNCNTSGFSNGMRGVNRVNWEYNYVHDFQYPEGPHLNCIRMVAQGGRMYRNMLTEGRSGSTALYLDDGDNNHSYLDIRENILAGIGADAHPSYNINIAKTPIGTPIYITIVDNMFGQNLYGATAGGGITWGSDGNEWSGNMYWVDSYSTSSMTFHAQGETV